MKLHNQSLIFLSVSIFIIISIWAAIFYFNMLDEIHDTIDDRLSNKKELIIQKIKKDPSALWQTAFDESNYIIIPITKPRAQKVHGHYTDTVVYMPIEEEHEPVRMFTSTFEYNNRYFVIKVISSTVEEDDLIEDLFWSIIWLYVILIISIILINNVFLRKLWRPFYSLLQQLKNFRIDKHQKLPEIQTSTREFIELKKATDTLIKHTSDAYNNQKQFTENAAHELQTPLAIITNKLELLLEKGTLDNNDAEDLAQTLQITSRLTQLNKALLLLSKIENNQFVNNQDISVNKLVHQVVDGLTEFAKFKKVDIDIGETENPVISIDPALGQILISNLIKNAIFHNKKQGKVKITIHAHTLKISNTAENGALDPQNIFKRFHKNSAARQSTGLGLSIVQAICRIYDYSISYTFTGEHCFELHFS